MLFFSRIIAPRHMQIKFHRRLASASTAAAEKCRLQFHRSALAAAVLSGGYFAMVLADDLQRSFLLLGVLQIPVCISSGVSVARMWIYTNDRRLMQRSPEVLRIRYFLESSRGQAATYGLVSIAPTVAVALGAWGHQITAIKVVSAGILVLSGAMIASFMVCGRSLMHAIDESIRQKQEHQAQRQEVPRRKVLHKKTTGEVVLEEEEDEGAQPGETRSIRISINNTPVADFALLAARTKVKRVMLFAFSTVVQVDGLLLFAICSKYGTAAPLLLFASPITLVPPIWNMINIQLHAGRSRARRCSSGMLISTGDVLSNRGRSWWWSRALSGIRTPSLRKQLHQGHVVPFEALADIPTE
ncbi:unnamed protein product [Ectocarpus sp. 12 AP-2014]